MDPKLKAALDTIAWSEGTSTSPITRNDGFDVIVSGIDGPEIFDVYVDHPFAFGRPPKIVRLVPRLESTASGRYQVLLRFWQAYKEMLHLPDFSPASQDAVAIQQIKERGGLTLIESGDIEGAVKACSNIWASLPGSPYGQPTHPMDEVLAKYRELLAA